MSIFHTPMSITCTASEDSRVRKEAAPFIPLMSPKSNIKTICHGKPQYHPCKEYRIKGRITISRKFSDKKIPNLIKEKSCNLYDFMDKSLAVNGCIKYFNRSEVGVIDYGLHDKKTDGILYCVANQNKNKKRNYLYKMMNELYTAKELEDRYKITRDELPKSLQLQSQYMEQMELFYGTDIIQYVHENGGKWISYMIDQRIRFNLEDVTSTLTKIFNMKWNHGETFKPKEHDEDRIDFDLSTAFDGNDYLCNKFVGKTGYKAPKVYCKKKIFDARAADVWSLGIELFMMVIGAPPFKREPPIKKNEAVNVLKVHHGLIQQFPRYFNQPLSTTTIILNYHKAEYTL